MGIDIQGWVEVETFADESEEWWIGVINIAPLINRNYEMFASLFGARNRAGFMPIAEKRGIPPFASPQSGTLQQIVTLTSLTWVGWWEIQAMNWMEKSIHPVSVSYTYQGTTQVRRLGNWGQEADEVRKELITRGDALDADWKFLFALMEQLAQRFGSHEVRLVVGFD